MLRSVAEILFVDASGFRTVRQKRFSVSFLIASQTACTFPAGLPEILCSGPGIPAPHAVVRYQQNRSLASGADRPDPLLQPFTELFCFLSVPSRFAVDDKHSRIRLRHLCEAILTGLSVSGVIHANHRHVKPALQDICPCHSRPRSTGAQRCGRTADDNRPFGRGAQRTEAASFGYADLHPPDIVAGWKKQRELIPLLMRIVIRQLREIQRSVSPDWQTPSHRCCCPLQSVVYRSIPPAPAAALQGQTLLCLPSDTGSLPKARL